MLAFMGLEVWQGRHMTLDDQIQLATRACTRPQVM